MTPDGCRHCGRAARGHSQRWSSAAGWHGWAEPTDAQRLERMRARRARTQANRKAAEGATSTANDTNPSHQEGTTS